MKLNAKQLRHLIKEVTEDSDHDGEVRRTANEMSKLLQQLMANLPDENSSWWGNGEVYDAIHAVEQAVFNLAKTIGSDGGNGLK